jgi:IclR family mhp operon transcriptional activator
MVRSAQSWNEVQNAARAWSARRPQREEEMPSGERRDSTRYKQVRGLSRGLDVLKALNERPAGGWTLTTLSHHLNLHHTTVKRLLETLRADGYVHLNGIGGEYILTSKVKMLSAGHEDDDLLILASNEILPAVTQAILWPLCVSTRDGEAMVVRTDTNDRSPLAFHRSLGKRIPIANSATGYAYLATLPQPERHALMCALCGTATTETGPATNSAGVDRPKIYDGLACNDGCWAEHRDYSAISAPIMVNGRTVGCLTMGFPTRAMRGFKALREYGDAMRSTVHSIVANISRRAPTAQA